MSQPILILDYGSQFTQLIARRVRQAQVFSQVLPGSVTLEQIKAVNPVGIVLSGGPASVAAADAPTCDPGVFSLGVPVLGVCYGMQFMASFLGGKVEKGESRQQALIRECHEELDVTIDVKEVFMDVVHEYPDMTVHLTLFNAAISEGTPRMLEHNDIRWITVKEIPDYAFCPADEDILARLREQG